ncbi:hypothetical protein BV25DRAFT_1819179 [Artomyces pyxidatus]|uniref:Uncharacterized protein n=1 Tax=Artomyces pyxidatus TaxID=48021 RepID=A0ACB8TH09_9AGAM|nr:hypothetical protein BV25DRAFT_1819179 [Artomyces pyxidatus]
MTALTHQIPMPLSSTAFTHPTGDPATHHLPSPRRNPQSPLPIAASLFGWAGDTALIVMPCGGGLPHQPAWCRYLVVGGKGRGGWPWRTRRPSPSLFNVGSRCDVRLPHSIIHLVSARWGSTAAGAYAAASTVLHSAAIAHPRVRVRLGVQCRLFESTHRDNESLRPEDCAAVGISLAEYRSHSESGHSQSRRRYLHLTCCFLCTSSST